MGLRVLIISLAIWTIIQCTGYLTISIMAYLANDCEYEMDRSPFAYLIYVIYFRNTKCGPINWSNFDIDVDIAIQPNVPDVTEVAARTNTIALYYIIASSAWIFTSLVILMSTCVRCCGKMGYFVMYVPWVLVGLGTIALDIVATIYFIGDFRDTGNVMGTLNVLEVQDLDIFEPILSQVSAVTLSIPSLLFFLVSARIFIIFILNVLSVLVIARYGYKFQNQDSSVSNRNLTGQTNTMYESEPNYPNMMEQQKRTLPVVHVQQQPQYPYQNVDPVASRYIDSSKQLNPDGHPHNIYNDSTSSLNNRNRPGNDSFNSGQQIAPPFVVGRRESPSNDIKENGVRRTVEPLKGAVDDNLSERSSLSKEPAELRNAPVPVVVHSESGDAPVKKQPPPVPKKPTYDNRFTYLPPNEQVYKAQLANLRDSQGLNADDRRDSLSKQPEELRSQLPWSYFQKRDDSKTPKKANDVSFEEDDILPPVPVPDYTLHFPKSKRPTMDDNGTTASTTPATTTTNTTPSSDDGRWSGPEFVY